MMATGHFWATQVEKVLQLHACTEFANVQSNCMIAATPIMSKTPIIVLLNYELCEVSYFTKIYELNMSK